MLTLGDVLGDRVAKAERLAEGGSAEDLAAREGLKLGLQAMGLFSLSVPSMSEPVGRYRLTRNGLGYSGPS